MINPTKKYLCLALASIVLVTPIQTLATGAAPPATSNGSGSSNNILGDIQGQISGVIKGDSTGTNGNAAAPSPTEGMDSQAKEAAKACAAGEKGTLGEQMKTALGLHLEMAAIKPNVEQLFENTSSCFSGLTDIVDLSFAIPSLDMVTQAVAAAVQKYATQKICTAAEKATSMITGPINEGLNKVNGMLDLNGQLNDLVSNGLSSIDPELGAAYSPPPPGGTGTINYGGLFTDDAITFETGNGQSNVGSSNSQTSTANITGLNNSLSQAQSSLYPAQQELSQAQNRLRACQVQSGAVGGDMSGCGAAQQAFNAAQNKVNQIQSNIQSLQNQIAQATGNSGVNPDTISGGFNMDPSSKQPPVNTASNNAKTAPNMGNNGTTSTQSNNSGQQAAPKSSGGFMQSIQDLISGK